ncbi:MAG: response regulator [Anaerolineales bacterium]|nr:response regulator [Chloroflexota bacterium]MBL6980532.1 response regulator [Anaerolineales bacterium]
MRNDPIEILLVEDNPDHVELILDALQNNGLINALKIVNDGKAALDYLFQRGDYVDATKPGLVLLDINLPKIDGIEVLRQIKKDPELKTIPVIILSTSDNDEDIERCYGNGANSYIVKPVDFEKFRQAIQELKMYWIVSNRLPQ